MEPETDDEPLTPTGRSFLRPELSQIINCVVGVTNPLNVDAITSEITNSVMVQHPRFSSLLVTDSHGREHWRKTQVQVPRHIIVIPGEPTNNEDEDEDEDTVNEYLADLAVSSPLSTEKPLWEIHLLMAQKCMVFRFHHCLGDGISAMSMLSAICRRIDGGGAKQQNPVPRSRKSDGVGIWRMLMILWFTIVYAVDLVLRSLWVKDKRTVLSCNGGQGVELWPRKLATARFRLEDINSIRRLVPNSTINDVLLAVISIGFSRYLDIRSPKGLQDNFPITCFSAVNIRPEWGLLKELSVIMKSNSRSGWGNKSGAIMVPMYYCKDESNPLEYIKRAKEIMDKKKLSYAALFSYKMVHLLVSYLGIKISTFFCYRLASNLTFSWSNMVGPHEEMTIAGNAIRYIRASVSAAPHAITMHMVTYAGMANLQVLVAKDIIPSPKVLAKCFENALMQMKEAAEAATKSE